MAGILGLAAGAVAAATASAIPAAQAIVAPAAGQPLRAADVAAGVGVNVHLEYTDSGYADVERTWTALQVLGVTLVRDAAPDPRNRGQASYGVLAGRGVRFDVFVNGGDIASTLGRLAALQARYPGAVHAIEGPNEINNHKSFSFAGLDDRRRAATAYQTALYEAVKADAALKTIPVVAFTDYPATPGPCDIANFHSYPDSRGAPAQRLLRDASEAQAIAPHKPLVATEFGVFTQPMAHAPSQRGQARLILAGLLDNAAAGVEETYLYQLLDAYPDPGAKDSEKHYGLFDSAYRPKVSAQMLGRLMQLLQDHAADARSFPLRPIAVSIQGLPASARALAIEKADGETLIAVWNETPVWDGAKDIDLDGERRDVTLAPSEPRSASVVDLVDGRRTVSEAPGPVHLSLGSSPLVVVLGSPPAAP